MSLEIVVADVDDVHVAEQCVGQDLPRPACLIEDKSTIAGYMFEKVQVGASRIANQRHLGGKMQKVDSSPTVFNFSIVDTGRSIVSRELQQAAPPFPQRYRQAPIIAWAVPPGHGRAEVEAFGGQHRS